MRTPDEKKKKIFDKIFTDLHSMADGELLLDACMSFNPEALKRMPLRYKLIALGFAMDNVTLDKVQNKLLENNCPRLYSRSFREAMLIVAFQNHLSYRQWQELCEQCEDIIVPESRYFRENKITYAELERYVTENSESAATDLKTKQLTQQLERAIVSAGSDIEQLRRVLETNAADFSDVREKTRYYFCKYLYYWINQRIEAYFTACRTGRDYDLALSNLLCLRCTTYLRDHKTLPEDEKRKVIREAVISTGAVFDEFNNFFFEYASLSWVNILLETYADVSDIPGPLKKKLAARFKRNRPALKGLPDDEVISKHIELEEQEADEAGDKLYNRNRNGENALRKFIKGSLDIDRTVLICFLMFFAADPKLSPDRRITPDRLNDILVKCGYPMLHKADDFDRFVMDFFKSKDPEMFIYDIVVEMAHRSEDSFLYQIYAGATQHSEKMDEFSRLDD